MLLSETIRCAVFNRGLAEQVIAAQPDFVVSLAVYDFGDGHAPDNDQQALGH